MGETLWVDKAKLRECAKTVEKAANQVEDSAGKQAIPALAVAEATLAGSVTTGTLPAVGRALAEVVADMVTAMDGLAQGLETAANRFHTVDVVYGRATYPAAVPRNLL
jgi:hypothetical protein